MKRVVLLLTIFILISCKQESLLQSGPMVGYSQMREVAIWVQTKKSADVKIIYYDEEHPDKKYETNKVKTEKKDGYTAHLIADQLEPGRKYSYKLLINGVNEKINYPLEFQTQKLWQWRTDPPEFSFVTGSCAYINEEEFDRPGTPYGGQYEIFKSIYEKKPDFMVWLGDDVYFREADWAARSSMIKRYTHTRSLKELQPLLGSVHHYAIWDDHDFGPNNSDRSFWNKETSLEIFKLFWSNPSYGFKGMPGVTTYFEWGDAAFFMLDDRYYRTPEFRKNTDRTMLGKKQLEWLIDALCSCTQTFKFVCTGGQVINEVENWETYSTFPEEKEKLFDSIKEEKITGVMFLTGDRHFAEVNKMERDGTYPLYDFTLSPFTAGPNTHELDENKFRVKGSHFGERNFGVFKFTGPKNNRNMIVTVFNVKGDVLYSQTINENELK